MLSPEAVVDAIARCRAAGLINAPANDRDTELAAEVWLDDLADLADDELAHACREHRRDPERGRFMPTPADIRARVPRLTAPQLNPDAEVWDRIVAAGFSGPLGVELTEAQRIALARVGGRWHIVRAAVGVELATLRRRFLDECKVPVAHRLPVPVVPAIEGPPPRVATGTFTPWVPRTNPHPLNERAAQVQRARDAIARRIARDAAEGKVSPESPWKRAAPVEEVLRTPDNVVALPDRKRAAAGDDE